MTALARQTHMAVGRSVPPLAPGIEPTVPSPGQAHTATIALQRNRRCMEHVVAQGL